MKLTFCGAAREVTGSCYWIQSHESQILVDCGVFQGGRFAEQKNQEPFPFNPAEIQAVLVTHAHYDHVGRIPKLVKEGFTGKIFATEPTIELAIIAMKDAVHLMQDEAERHGHEPLYDLEDVEKVQQLWKRIDYHEDTPVAPGISAYYVDAGHILGSASIKVTADNQSAIFSGDLGNAPVPLLHQAECLTSSDILVIESTYGNRIHEGLEQRRDFIRQAVLDAYHSRGTLLIPAFALERTQELLYEIHLLEDAKEIPQISIFLDSPMAIEATEVFRRHTDMMSKEAHEDQKELGDLFSFKGLRYAQTSTDSKAILHVPAPKVIIAGSGMMNGGRIMHHLRNYLGFRNTILLIVGYQVEGSLGRKLYHGDKLVHIYGSDIGVRADVRSCGAFSGHADYPRIMHWLNCFQNKPPRKIFVTHGELNSALSLSQSIEDNLGLSSSVPQYGDTVDLDHFLTVQ